MEAFKNVVSLLLAGSYWFPWKIFLSTPKAKVPPKALPTQPQSPIPAHSPPWTLMPTLASLTITFITHENLHWLSSFFSLIKTNSCTQPLVPWWCACTFFPSTPKAYSAHLSQSSTIIRVHSKTGTASSQKMCMLAQTVFLKSWSNP